MKKICAIIYYSFFIALLSFSGKAFSQNIGIGISIPLAKFHIKGLSDTSQLVIDANSVQTNSRPLIKLRNSSGTELLRIHSDDPTNVFIGQFAGRINNANVNGGIFNTFIGGGSGYNNSSGYWNAATGRNALYSNNTGFNNTAQGVDALYSNTSGIYNTAMGTYALRSNINGLENTAVGVSALYTNTNGRSNTAVGMNALYLNTAGNNNTATGYYALYKNSTGINNTATGYQTLWGNTTGSYNTATGMEALFNNPPGIGNTANGFQAFYFFNGNTGDQNTAVGSYTLSNVLTSSYNTGLGNGAGSGSAFYMGWNNSLIGANTKANAPGIFNSIALGESALSSANNQARIGNSSTTSIGGYVGWSNISDGRVKKNIQYNVPGLSFINKLTPVTYNLDLDIADRIIQPGQKKDSNGNIIPTMQFETGARKQKALIVYTGFIAQDVKKAAKEINYDFSGVDTAKSDKDLHGLRYAEFVVSLVQVAQELSKQNDELLKRIEKIEYLLRSKK
jgi:trimeric autotransporter adhesin